MADFDDRYTSFRDHAAAVQKTDSELSRLRERQATTEASLLHEMNAVRSDVNEIKMMLLRPVQPPVDHGALAMQRALDLMERKTGGGAQHPILTGLAILGAIASGFLAASLLGQ